MPAALTPAAPISHREAADLALSNALMRIHAAAGAAVGARSEDTPENAAAVADLVSRAVTDAQVAIAKYRRAAGGN